MMPNQLSERLTSPLSLALTGQADVQDWLSLSDTMEQYLPPDRLACLLATCAIAADHADVLRLASKVVAEARVNAPMPVLLDISEDAQWWADLATDAELRAWLLACYQSLPPREQQSFLEAASRRVAA